MAGPIDSPPDRIGASPQAVRARVEARFREAAPAFAVVDVVAGVAA